MTGALRQLAALLQVRWQMARAPGVRLGIAFSVVVLAWLLYVIIGSARSINPIVLATAIDVAPLAFLGFGALAVIAPLTAGGGNEVVPADQLVAFPIRARTQFLGGLLLAPLNLVWVIQLLTLAALTAYLAFGGRLVLSVVTTVAYVLFITVVGQALAWWVVGLRQTRAGRRVVGATGVALFAVAVVVTRSGGAGELQETSPTRHVVFAVSAGALGNYVPWAVVTALLLAFTALGLLLGSRACRWALGRPGDAGSFRRAEVVRRRGPKSTPLRELVAIDRASVWRAPALRRGGLVLVLLPGLLAAGAAVPWSSLVVLPGLVAAGAGLLFGVNAFCLDASGAVWLASLPHDPRLALQAKALVLTEVVLSSAVIAAVAGSLRSPGVPTPAELTAIVASAGGCTAVVVAVALKASIRRPHRADLNGPRDAVAPPGSLAMASTRLALPTAAVGFLLGAAAQTGFWWLPLALSVPLLMVCGLSINRSVQRWNDPFTRARIVQVVAQG